MEELSVSCMKLRGLIQLIESAITFNQPLNTIDQINQRVTFATEFLNLLDIELNPTNPEN
jgi:hypothetical protein